MISTGRCIWLTTLGALMIFIGVCLITDIILKSSLVWALTITCTIVCAAIGVRLIWMAFED